MNKCLNCLMKIIKLTKNTWFVKKSVTKNACNIQSFLKTLQIKHSKFFENFTNKRFKIFKNIQSF